MNGVRRTLPVLVGLALLALLAVHDARGQARGSAGDPVSELIFPPGESMLRFSHAAEAHRELECERCHVDALGSRRADDRLVPPERTCLPCHAGDIARDEPSAERCGTCHVGYGTGGRRVVPASRRPTPRLRFDHREHARRGVACLECHAGVLSGPGSTDPAMPTMRSCFRCHGGLDPSASSDCTTCHLVRPDGRLRTRYPGGWLNPPRWLGGMHHDADWLVRHRWIAADQGDACASCHTEDECADCHDGRVRPERVHPNDWLTIHSQMARRDEPRCTSCHTTQTFCTECHARLGISPLAAPNVRSGERFHPPAEVWTRGPVLHGREARRSMTTCTSCHAERDCITCHGAIGLGSGRSPHPPGFLADCRRLLEANDRACRSCHGDLGRVRALCR